jgi:type II secretory pathway pseudopilin PulG
VPQSLMLQDDVGGNNAKSNENKCGSFRLPFTVNRPHFFAFTPTRHAELVFAETPTLFSKLVTSQRKQEAASHRCSLPERSRNKFGMTPSAYAFTLAEVLIVLGLIGIVATMTIPTLIGNTEKNQYYSQFMSIYSLMVETSQMVLTDYAGDLSGNFANTEELMNAYGKHLKVLKSCPEGAINDCWNGDVTYRLGHRLIVSTGTIDSSMILANGVRLRFSKLKNDFSNSCQSQDNYFYKGSTKYTACDIVWVDINGHKAPNELGRDTYLLIIYGTIPILADGIPGTQDGLESCEDGGYGCAGKLILDRKMDY